MLPIVIVITARTPRANVQSRFRTTIPRTIILIAAANPTFFVPAARRAAIGGGAPSYVSGSHWWKGTSPILNPNPAINIPTESKASGNRDGSSVE